MYKIYPTHTTLLIKHSPLIIFALPRSHNKRSLFHLVLPAQLATHGTRHGERRVNISIVRLGVLLNLPNMEPISLIRTTSSLNTRLKRASQAPKANALIAIARSDRVGERQTRRASIARNVIVDVGGGDGGRLVVAFEAVEGDVVADGVVVGVDAEVEVGPRAGQAAGEGAGGVDDFVGGALEGVGRGELEHVRLGPLGLPVVWDGSGRA